MIIDWFIHYKKCCWLQIHQEEILEMDLEEQWVSLFHFMQKCFKRIYINWIFALWADRWNYCFIITSHNYVTSSHVTWTKATERIKISMREKKKKILKKWVEILPGRGKGHFEHMQRWSDMRHGDLWRGGEKVSKDGLWRFRAVSGKEKRVMEIVDRRCSAMWKVWIIAVKCFSKCDPYASCIKPNRITS